MSDYQFFTVQQHVDVTVLHLNAQKILERSVINRLETELLDLADKVKPKKVLINFGGVAYCSSEFIGALMRFWKRVAENGGLVRLSGMKEQIREVFQITKLEGSVFDIYDSIGEGLTNF
jgi:anti-anti-sigma factor